MHSEKVRSTRCRCCVAPTQANNRDCRGSPVPRGLPIYLYPTLLSCEVLQPPGVSGPHMGGGGRVRRCRGSRHCIPTAWRHCIVEMRIHRSEVKRYFLCRTLAAHSRHLVKKMVIRYRYREETGPRAEQRLPRTVRAAHTRR